LSRFYGGTRAEESLLEASRIAVGSGALKRHDAMAIQREWQRRMGRESRRHRAKPGSANPAVLSLIGIAVDDSQGKKAARKR
jgi:L-alanine-DL-glutamate epimerase-like enolase superfamily enzyme